MSATRHPVSVMLAFFVAVAVSLGGVLMVDAAAAASTSQASYESAPCVVEVPLEHRDRVRCGYLTVPERRDEGADPARTLRLPVAIVSSTAAEPALDPLVFPTSGGPGGGSLSSLPLFLDWAEWATSERDVILIEQRGDALAEPSLECPELDLDHFVDDGVFLTGAAADARTLRQTQACRDRLTEAGIDPAAYTSAASAADLADLRIALGYDAWNLYGISYGARLALTTMRDHPDGLRTVILDGPYPPQVNRYEAFPAGVLGAIAALVARCDADTGCAEAYPDLAATLADVLARAAEEPLVIEVKHPVDRTPLRVALTDDIIMSGLVDALYRPDAAALLPFVIDRLAQGDGAAALPLVEQNLATFGWLTQGLELSMECAEEIPFNDDARIAEALAADPLLAHLRARPLLREECAIWGVPALGAHENAPVTSSIPTLITTGGLDPITPRAWGEIAAQGLSQVYLVDFANMGHGAVWWSWFDGCAASVAGAFLRDPAVAPNAPCMGRAASTDFLTRGDVHATSSVYRFARDVLQDRDPIQVASIVALLLALVTTFVAGIAYGIAWLARRRGRAPEGAVLAATIAAGANLAFVGAMSLVFTRSDPVLLGFGLPAGAWPLVILPLVGLAATIVLVVLLGRAWRGGDGTTGHRIALSLAAAALLAFTAWLLVRGLIVL